MKSISVLHSKIDSMEMPSPAPDGAEVLWNVRNFIKRFCIFPDEHSLVAVTLWAAHTHMVGHFHTTPRLAVLSAELSSGKTRVLEILHLLIPDPMFSLSASPAAVFRTLSKQQITLLFDEVDTIWKSRGRDDHNEDLRALLNAGYKRGASIPRCVGAQHDVAHFPVFCAAALAGIGELPETVMSPSVIIKMRRRAPGEHVEPFRVREHESLGHVLRDQLRSWAELVRAGVGEAWPEMPEGIVDRPAEVWEPLVAVADAAGGDWPAAARVACVELCRLAEDRRVSLAVRLLGDLRTIFGGADALHTETIIERLVDGENNGLPPDAPWAELHGKPISVRQLASLLKPHGVRSQKVTVNGRSLQGYRREHLWDPWQRYLPPIPGEAELPELLELPPGSQPRPVPQIPQVPDSRTQGRGIDEEIYPF